MDGKTTIKYVAFYQLLAAVAAIVGFAVVGLGVLMGFGESIDIVMNEAPQDWENAVDAAQPVTFAALTVVGVLVWQLGKSLALVYTMGKVSAASGAGGDADVETIESTVMDRVNDRISGVEADVKEHEQQLASASGASSGDRRSRRRGTAATGDDASTGSSSTSGSSSASAGGSDSSSDVDGTGDAGSSSTSETSSTSGSGSTSSGGESNRRSNRRASRGGSGDKSDSADGDSA